MNEKNLKILITIQFTSESRFVISQEKTRCFKMGKRLEHQRKNKRT